MGTAVSSMTKASFYMGRETPSISINHNCDCLSRLTSCYACMKKVVQQPTWSSTSSAPILGGPEGKERKEMGVPSPSITSLLVPMYKPKLVHHASLGQRFPVAEPDQFSELHQLINSPILFPFIFKGTLAQAVKKGEWILLDEINLATAETLECLSGLLEGLSGSLVLLDRGDTGICTFCLVLLIEIVYVFDNCGIVSRNTG